jgi:hypothetical protein
LLFCVKRNQGESPLLPDIKTQINSKKKHKYILKREGEKKENINK